MDSLALWNQNQLSLSLSFPQFTLQDKVLTKAQHQDLPGS